MFKILPDAQAEGPHAETENEAAGKRMTASSTHTERPLITGATADDLPDELLLSIVRITQKISGSRELHSLCLVSRRAYSIAVPSLYESYTFDRDRKDYHRLFLRTLVLAPGLCQYVKGIGCQYEYELSPVSEDMSFHPNQKALRTKSTLETPELTSFFKRARLDTYFALALSLCPNLRSVAFEEITGPATQNVVEQTSYLAPLLSATFALNVGHHRFSRLTSLSIPIEATSTSRASALFQHPSLVYLAFTSLGDDDFEVAMASASKELALWNCPERCSGIKTLIIGATLPSSIIAKMLHSIKSLENFISTGRTWLEMDPNWYAVLSRALRRHGQSLKYIVLSNITHVDDMHGPPTHSHLEFGDGCPFLTTFYGSLTSLLNWEKMRDGRHLEAILAILPASVEVLLLEVDDNWDLNDLVDLSAEFPHERYPCLKRLCITFCLTTLERMPLQLITLRKYFSQTRIDFTFRLDVYDLDDTSDAIAEVMESTRALGPEGAELVDTYFGITCTEGNSWSVVSHEV